MKKIASPPRLLSLDAFRGLTIAGMLLVNNPGSWGADAGYTQLRHASWHGCTATDLVFPFFLFIVGVAMVFSFEARSERGDSRGEVMRHVWRRSAALVLLGLFMNRFPLVERSGDGLGAALAATGVGGCIMRLGMVVAFAGLILALTAAGRPRLWKILLVGGGTAALVGAAAAPDGEVPRLLRFLLDARVPGVLQRIGLCYLAASALLLYVERTRTLAAVGVGLLVLTTWWMVFLPLPGGGLPDLDVEFTTVGVAPITNWAMWLDTHLLGGRAWLVARDVGTGDVLRSLDPEGLASTPTALCTVLLGVFCGMWLRYGERTPRQTSLLLLMVAAPLLLVGWLLHRWLPLNKTLWTASYVLFTGGAAFVLLALFHEVIEVRGRRLWARPLAWYGSNAITAFFLSSLTAVLSVHLRVGEPSTALKTWLFESWWLSWLPLRPASAGYALGVVVIWAIICGVMHRRRIFWKI